MSNVIFQRFGNDELESKFIKIYQNLLKQSIDDVDSIIANIYKSRVMGQALLDNKAVPIYSLLAEQIFLQSFSEFVEAELAIGTIDAYCRILYSVFGSNATIIIDRENPFHIKINLVARYVEYFVWVDEKKEVYITTEAGEYLGFAALVARLTNRQLADILKRMTNAGVFLEFTYEQGSPNDGD